MKLDALVHIRKAISTLNPHQIRELAERPVRVALHAQTQEAYQRMENFFLRDLAPARRRQSALQLVRAPIPVLGQTFDIAVYDEDIVSPPDACLTNASAKCLSCSVSTTDTSLAPTSAAISLVNAPAGFAAQVSAGDRLT